MIKTLLLSVFLFFFAGTAANSAQTNVSSSFAIKASGFVLNRSSGTFNSTVTLTNTSASTFSSLWFVVSNLPNGVSVANAYTTNANGAYQILVSLTNGQLGPGGSASLVVQLTNPNKVGVSPAYSVLGLINATVPNVVGLTQSSAIAAITQANLTAGAVTSLQSATVAAGTVMQQNPAAGTVAIAGTTVYLLVSSGPPAGGVTLGITSIPPTATVVGKTLQYQVTADSPQPSSLTYALTTGPAGMTINPTSGLLTWSPTQNQVGDQSVVITVQDATGQVTQNFTLSVFGTKVETTAIINAAIGGTLTVNDASSNINGLTITIPPGALSANTTFTISSLVAPPTLGGVQHFELKGFMVEPDGTALSVPATITVPYQTSEFNTSRGIPLEQFLGVDYLDPTSGNLLGMNFSVDSVNHDLIGTVPHFSIYLLDNQADLCPPPALDSSGNRINDCPSGYAPTTRTQQIPALMIHGFMINLGSLTFMENNESYWGNLRALLEQLNDGGATRIDAWRFDWNTKTSTFENAAYHLKVALQTIKSLAAQSSVNIIAHSMGGILARTYLQGFAQNGGYVPYDPNVDAYGDDVNRLMTVGTPDQGIGGIFSNFIANACAWSSVNSPASALLYFETCYETATGLGGGQFLQLLNGPSNPLPVLQTGVAPSYYFIAGDTSPNGSTPAGTDGLITAVGTALCGPDPQVCVNATPQTTLVQGLQGLCHAVGLITCSSSDAPEVTVSDRTHPMWSNICTYLDSVDAASPTSQNQLCDGTAIGGTVSGLTGTGLILLDNGGDQLTTLTNGSFTFPTPILIGNTYNVTVGTEPPGQSCTVSGGDNGSGGGTVTAGGPLNITSVIVTCTYSSGDSGGNGGNNSGQFYSVGGQTSGLTGTGLVLLDNGSDQLTINSNGPFAFPTALASGAAYNVTVGSQPSGQS